MLKAIDRATGSVWFRLGVAGLLGVALVFNAIAVARPMVTEDETARLEARLAALEQEAGELRQSQLELLDRAFRLQNDIAILAPEIASQLDGASAELDAFVNSDIVFDVAVNETVPIKSAIAVNRTIDVSIDTSLPIDETIETTITVDGPFGLEIPLSVTVPIALDLPVALTVPLTIDEEIPIDASVPITTAVPVVVDVDQTELVRLVDGLQTMLAALERVLESLS